MKVIRVSNRIWYSAFEEERDRPGLGYIRGDHWSIAIDAGHSAAHVEEFYKALTDEKLPLPALTVITHWHWDHAFGMHRVNGICIANSKTNKHLREYAGKIASEGEETFLSLDPSIRKEYEGNNPIIVVPADIEFDRELHLNPGGISVHLFTSVSPHTDDTTLVYIPEEKFMFVGDCISGVFPTWKRDSRKTKELITTIEKMDAEYCLGGHWPLFRKQEMLDALKEDLI
jgi:glyoxylase-like metal-dependent hydrolase (beta-lactamase superfamily II)